MSSEESASQLKLKATQLFASLEEELTGPQKTPLSTYRVQFHKGFGFEDAQALVPYLDTLGVTDLYASPCFKAAPGSMHGYDVVDPTTLNPELGTAAQHDALCAALSSRGMGQLLDVVPNHMGIERDNAMWLDVLENGPSSIYARFFDIDWDPVKDELKDKVLLPILGDQYGAVLERGELQLQFEDGAFWVAYFDHRFPVAPRQYIPILSMNLEGLVESLGAADPGLVELQSILTALEHLPARTETERAKVQERNREKEVIKRRLAAVAEQYPSVRDFIGRNVKAFNGQPGSPRTFDRLDAVLNECSYRLAHWRVAGEEINYRRFFDINSLAAVRAEDREVFDHSHSLVFKLLAERKVTGLRIDHPDGLFDPTAYFLALQECHFLERARQRAIDDGLDPADWSDLGRELRQLFQARFEERPESPIFRALYVVVEKIQGGRERIPEAWAIHGTTGYRYANMVSGIFVDRANEQAFTDTYSRFIGQLQDFEELLYAKKKLIMSVSMSSEINVLARELNRISELNRRTRDFTLNSLRRALVEFIALFPVYRTYVDAWRPEVDLRDIRYIEWTIDRARERDPNTNVTLFNFLKDVLLRRYPEHVGEAERTVMLRFAMKLQQLTGPVMAKALEDTTFYIYNRLVSLNEVGGEPQRFGTSLETFHLRNQERAENWPAALLATSTHDTKRSEDVRARLAALSELPREWREKLRKWSKLNRVHKSARDGRLLPDSNDEYLFYQTLVGAWPMGSRQSPPDWEEFRIRLRDYMQKAIKEAKVNTSWVNPEPDYDQAMSRFVDQVLALDNKAFLEDAFAFKLRLEKPGQVNALSQLMLKLSSPGTPDIYQGCELWDLSLVDPDNRRPVDFSLRKQMLEELDQRAEVSRLALCRELAGNLDDGRLKLYALACGLRLRRRIPWLFRQGWYLPLSVSGPKEPHAVALARTHPDGCLVAVVPRLVTPLLESSVGLAGSFHGTWVQLPAALAGAQVHEVLTGQTFQVKEHSGAPALELSELLKELPVCLLEKS